MLDQDTGITVFESGAILIYLAVRKLENFCLPTKNNRLSPGGLMLHDGSVGSRLVNYLLSSVHRPRFLSCYEKETLRLYGVKSPIGRV